MTQQTTIDIHAHILPEETIGLLQKTAPSLALRIRSLDERSGILEIAGVTQKPFPARRGTWSGASGHGRLRVDIQLLSNTPQAFLYEQEAALVRSAPRFKNDQIASLVGKYPERFRGLATLPMQAPEMAARELRRRWFPAGFSAFTWRPISRDGTSTTRHWSRSGGRAGIGRFRIRPSV